MFKVKALDAIGHSLGQQESLVIADSLRASEVVDLALMSSEDAEQMIEELERILDCHTDRSVLSYKQILVGQERALLNWGTGSEDHAVSIELDAYPVFRTLLGTVVAISDQLRSPKENLLLSIIPSLRKASTFPRHFHRESHISLEQLKVEGKSPSIYRMTCDLGLQNSHEVLNVNLVPRRKLLNRDGRIKRKYANLFQQDHIDVCKIGAEKLSFLQGQMTEDMLPFPETRRKLMVGRALIWLDDLFFHTPYLRSGRSPSELREHPRSIVIINEFRGNSYHDISWTPCVRRLLRELLPDMSYTQAGAKSLTS